MYVLPTILVVAQLKPRPLNYKAKEAKASSYLLLGPYRWILPIDATTLRSGLNYVVEARDMHDTVQATQLRVAEKEALRAGGIQTARRAASLNAASNDVIGGDLSMLNKWCHWFDNHSPTIIEGAKLAAAGKHVTECTARDHLIGSKPRPLTWN